ncbi:MAG: phage scaffolding protein [Anaerobutyricum soehngenii]
MKTEFLKSLNLSQEVIDKIMAENGKDIAVEQKKAEKVIQERDSYKLKAESLETQVNDANTEIQKFKDMDIDGIKKAADDWKETAEKAKADADKQISQMKFDYALSAALTGAKAKNAKAVKALLDMDGLKFNDGKIVGLDEQLAQIKTDNDYLFESDEPAPEFVKGTNGGSGSVGGKKPSEMTYTELCDYMAQNPGAEI